MANEVRNPEDAFRDIPESKPDKQMIEIALKIVEQQEGEFEPDKFVDRYEQALKALIHEKQKGHTPVRAPEPKDTNVIDLMSALKKSLKADRAPAPKKAPSARRAAKSFMISVSIMSLIVGSGQPMPRKFAM